jgi:hypothetical protein
VEFTPVFSHAANVRIENCISKYNNACSQLFVLQTTIPVDFAHQAAINFGFDCMIAADLIMHEPSAELKRDRDLICVGLHKRLQYSRELIVPFMLCAQAMRRGVRTYEPQRLQR